MGELEQLRALRKLHDGLAEQYRTQAAEHGVEAVRISRAIAKFPCDVARNRDELIIHLGWHHKRHGLLNATKKELLAIHEQLVHEGSG